MDERNLKLFIIISTANIYEMPTLRHRLCKTESSVQNWVVFSFMEFTGEAIISKGGKHAKECLKKYVRP